MGNWVGKEWFDNEEKDKIDDNSSVIVADFDPRSPSNGILR
jgi:hypothetical protein